MGVIKHPAGETGNPEPTNRRNLSLSSLSILSSLKLCCLHKFLLDHSLPSSILSQPTIGRYLFYLYHSLLSTNHHDGSYCRLILVAMFLCPYSCRPAFHLPIPPPALLTNTISPHYLMAIAHCAEIFFARLSISLCTHCASERCIPYL